MPCFPRVAAALLFFSLAAAPAKTTGRKTRSGSNIPPGRNAAVQRWMRGLSLHDKVAQLVVMPCYGEAINVRSKTFREYRRLVRDVHIGGLIVLGHSVHGSIENAEPYAMAVFLNRMQRLAKVPLLTGADLEHGAAMRVQGATPWPQNMAFAAANDIAAARYEGAATAREARALGLNWIFAPVADVNSNPDNPIINIRSYGEDPTVVGQFVRAYIQGAHSDPKNAVLVTAKHFPGHGNTSEDSHMGLARNDETREQLERIDLPPFREAVSAGVDAVMTAHMAVPAIEPQPIPSTVSQAVLTGLLKDELKFTGLVVTDAMDMQGLTRLYHPAEAAARAIEAGADVLLMPKSADEAIRGVMRAVQEGKITRKRLDESVAKVLAAKVRLGLNRKSQANLDGIGEVFNAPEDDERAQQVADEAVTLVKNANSPVPLKASAGVCLTVLAESRRSHQGQHLADEFKTRAPQMKIQILDPALSAADLDQAAAQTAGCAVNVVAAYVTVAEYRGNTALAGDYPALVNKLITGAAPVVLVALGNPYIARAFPGVAAYLTTYSTVATSETAAAKALFGEIAIGGKLPVTIPGFAKYGDGIALASASEATKGVETQ